MDKHDDKPAITLRSQRVRTILSQKPSVIVRWGTILIVLFFLLAAAAIAHSFPELLQLFI